MKWICPKKNVAYYKADGILQEYHIKKFFFLDMQWVIEIVRDKKSIRIPATFGTYQRAKKVAELIEKG